MARVVFSPAVLAPRAALSKETFASVRSPTAPAIEIFFGTNALNHEASLLVMRYALDSTQPRNRAGILQCVNKSFKWAVLQYLHTDFSHHIWLREFEKIYPEAGAKFLLEAGLSPGELRQLMRGHQWFWKMPCLEEQSARFVFLKWKRESPSEDCGCCAGGDGRRVIGTVDRDCAGCTHTFRRLSDLDEPRDDLREMQDLRDSAGSLDRLQYHLIGDENGMCIGHGYCFPKCRLHTRTSRYRIQLLECVRGDTGTLMACNVPIQVICFVLTVLM